MTLCLHCGKKPGNRPRGLCATCYANTSIRSLHPPKQLPPELDPDATEEQLNAVIAEQMQCLPPWWDESAKIMETKRR